MKTLHLLLGLYVLFVLLTLQFPDVFSGFIGSVIGKLIFIFIIVCITAVDTTAGLLVTVIFISLEIFLALQHGAGRGLGRTSTAASKLTREAFGESLFSSAPSSPPKTDSKKSPPVFEEVDITGGSVATARFGSTSGGIDKKTKIEDVGYSPDILAAGSLLSSATSTNKAALAPASSSLMTTSESLLSATQKSNPNVGRASGAMAQSNVDIMKQKMNTETFLVRKTGINYINQHNYKGTPLGNKNPSAASNILSNDTLNYTSLW